MPRPEDTRPAVTVLSHPNVYGVMKGNAAYLNVIANALRADGCQLDYLTTVKAGAAPRLAVNDYLKVYRSVRSPGRLIIGNRGYALKPAAWLAALGRRRRRANPPASRRLWSLPELDDATARWMADLAVRRRARAVFANYFNTAAAFAHLRGDVVKVIVVHDVMALRQQSLEAVGLPLDFDPHMVARERAAFRRADICVAIKAEEAAYIRAEAPGTEVVTIPFAAPRLELDVEAARAPSVVFVGSDNFPNRDALLWLLAEIWPAIRRQRPTACLRVVGNVGGSYQGVWPAGAAAVGVVDDLASEYRRACVALVPLRVGSGLKIKTVEALAAGLPCVTTSVGAEGVPQPPREAVVVADETASFVAAIVDALDRREQAGPRRAARDYARAEFSEATIRARLRGIVAPFRA